MKKLLAILLTIVMVMGLVTAASAQSVDLSKNETDVVCIGVSRDSVPGSEDVFYCWEGTYVWEALTINRGGNIDPWLAESWEHNDDCTEWVFHLRSNVTFSDGEPFNAEAVLANIARWDKGISSGYTSLTIKKSLPNLAEMVAVDDLTVKFTFSAPITTL